MPQRRQPDPADVRESVLALSEWLSDPSVGEPSRNQLALAVRNTARTLEHIAPGHSVEVRVPPFVAVQCVEGPRHTRGTPPNVVEMDPRTWLQLATGLMQLDDALAAHLATASGTRAREISQWLPIIPLSGSAQTRQSGRPG